MAEIEERFEEVYDELRDELEEMCHEKRYNDLRKRFLDMNPADIAWLFDDMPEDHLPVMFRLLSKEVAADVFINLESDSQEMLIKGFSNAELEAILDEMFLDDTIDVIEEMPANVVKRILKYSDPETRREINKILQYPEDSAGSLMTTEFIRLRRGTTVAGAFDVIRQKGDDSETINVSYVTDEERHLIGYVTIRTLVLEKDTNALIGDIMEPNVISAMTTDDKESVVQRMSKYDFDTMPVVDGENRLVGIITFDDAIDVIEEEATEDIEKMAAITPSDRPYLRTGIFDIWKSRIPWLMILMLSSTFTGMIISSFEDALAACVVLTAFIPMLMGTGGNCSNQTSATVIRGLSLQEIEFRDVFKVMWKEARVGLLAGLSLAAVSFVKVLLFDGWLLGNPEVTPMVSAVISLTLVLTVFCSKIVGAFMPLFAKKVGADPAVMASPFITTVVDALSLVIYFAFATMLLGI
ncbi:MAG: magnesium transporter [Oscillospiraceae bacterium]|nr:magnesium transporter [Oscillospiraceae bacterium]